MLQKMRSTISGALSAGRAFSGLAGLYSAWTYRDVILGVYFVVTTTLAAWFAAHSSPLSGYGWGTYPLVGIVVAALVFYLGAAGWRRLYPAPLTHSSTALASGVRNQKKTPVFQPSRSVVVVAINWDLGYLQPNRLDPCMSFMCVAFNGLPYSIKLQTADGRVSIGGQEIRDVIELRGEDDIFRESGLNVEKYSMFRFVLRARLGDRARDHIHGLLLADGVDRVALSFVEAKVLAMSDDGDSFYIRMPSTVKFDAKTGQAKPMLVGH